MTRTDYPSSAGVFNQLATGDLNNDDHTDIAVMWGSSTGPFSFTVYYGDGLGGFSIGPSFPKTGKYPTAIGVGDVNFDFRDDVIIGRGGNYAEILVYTQQPSGTLELTATHVSYDSPESLDVVDINCDGVNDIVATNAGFLAFSWWPGQRDGTLGYYQIEKHAYYFSHIGPNGAEMADVNGDGLKDYVVVDYNSDGVLVALQKQCYKLRMLFIGK